MNTKKQTALLSLIGILLFNNLFWSEKMGLNAMIFSLFIIGSLSYLHKDCWHKKEVIITGAGTLFCSVLVILVNSWMVQFSYWFSLFAFSGFVQQRQLRHLFYAFSLIFINAFKSPYLLAKTLLSKDQDEQQLATHKAGFDIRLFFIPTLVLSLFYIVYYCASPDFARISDEFWNSLFARFVWKLSFGQTLFIILSVLVCGGLMIESNIGFFIKKQLQKSYVLRRVRDIKKGIGPIIGMGELKREYKSAVIILLSLNLLLLIVNLIDAFNVWFKAGPQNAYELKMYVHEGTYLLILAIFMAMAVLVFFFRKNLNFIRDNEFLRHLSYLWLIQNAVLTFSVGIRNYRYIENCGLAYKRIGVILFLILCLYGLYTLFVKIEKKRTFHFLVYRNAWALYFLLMSASLINWDHYISRYNIQKDIPNGIDVSFLLYDVSDKNLALLEENIPRLVEKTNDNYRDKDWIEKGVDYKRRKFNAKQKGRSWRSWNLQDWNTERLNPIIDN